MVAVRVEPLFLFLFFLTDLGKEAYTKISTSILFSKNKLTPSVWRSSQLMQRSDKLNFFLYYELCKFRKIKPPLMGKSSELE